MHKGHQKIKVSLKIIKIIVITLVNPRDIGEAYLSNKKYSSVCVRGRRWDPNPPNHVKSPCRLAYYLSFLLSFLLVPP